MANYQGKRVERSRRIAAAVIVLVIAAVIGTAVFFVWNSRRGGGEARDPGAGSTAAGASAGSSAAGSVSAPEPAVTVLAPDVSEKAEVPPYDFSQPVPEGEAVENSYFDDTAFIGDSRTNGFMLYSGIGTGEDLSSTGISIFKLAERKSLTINGEEYTALEALALKEYGKVYIALGVNELGYHNDKGYYEKFCAAIDEIRRIQPNAVIYIQSLIPVNEEQSQAHTGKDYLTNDHLRVYNQLMQQVAEEKQVAYLDVYEAFADENGALPEGDSRDGVHLVKAACVRWLDYLKTHTVDFDTLYPDGPPVPETPDPAEPGTSTEDGSVQG